MRTSFKPECKLDRSLLQVSGSQVEPEGCMPERARIQVEQGGIFQISVLIKEGQGLRCVLEVEWRSCLLGGREAGEERSRKPTACGGEKQGVWGGESKLGKRVWEGLGGCQGLVLPLGGC